MIQPARSDESSDSTPLPGGDSALEDLIEECTNRLQAGESIDLDDLAARHPEHAERLRRLLPSLRMMAEVGRTAAGPLPPVLAAGPILEPSPAGSFELGDYRILRMIGRGGMGVVYEAIQLSLNRRVALKVLPFAAALDPHQLRRFQIEAQAAAQLHHTSIVPVFSVGCERGVHFYAMQNIEGRTIAALIQERREASRPGDGPARPSADREYIRSVARLGIQAAEALDHAHRQGIIHRDIKPANLLVDTRGALWITDFGLARFVNEAGLTLTGDLIGTLRYMSPEQALAKRLVLDHRTDIYSLGATLYELLTLRPVVDGRDRQEVLRRIAQDEPVPLRRIDSAIPRDFETILLKALAREPEGRYATAEELAEELRRFLEHRPIKARRPNVVEQAAKWLRRHPALVGSAVMILALAVIGLAAGTVWTNRALRQALRQRDEARARGLLRALVVAETRSVPEILRQLSPDRALVRDQLRALATAGESTRDAVRQRLHAALALLPDDPDQIKYLTAYFLRGQTQPDEVRVVGQALQDHHDMAAMIPRLWSDLPVGTTDLNDPQLRIAAALALLDPSAPRWEEIGPPVADKLVRENPLLTDSWRELFQPVHDALLTRLRAHYGDRDHPERRPLAYSLLYEFAARSDGTRRLDEMVDLIADAEPTQFRDLMAHLRMDEARAVRRLTALIAPPVRFDVASARRQGRIMVALALLGRTEPIWPALRHSDDPGLRTEVIHGLAPLGFPPQMLVARLDAETEVSARRGLLLALGQYPLDEIASGERPTLTARLLAWYRTDPDPGVHGAIDWVLRQRWGHRAYVEKVDRELSSRAPARDRDWYINGEEQTFTVIRGPVTYQMGSTPESDPERDLDEAPHAQRIERSFAIATKEVTVREYSRFLADRPGEAADWRGTGDFQRLIRDEDCPIGKVTWYEAARYCNWLSAREGLPEDQWYYPKRIGPGMELLPDMPVRTGYRLPTEAEWEYACRAGAASARPYGRAVGWLSEYGWSGTNSGLILHPVGRLKPNDLGLFDILGNAWEFCTDGYGPYQDAQGSAKTPIISEATFLSQRGACLNDDVHYLRSAYRAKARPIDHNMPYGFRLARTIGPRR